MVQNLELLPFELFMAIAFPAVVFAIKACDPLAIPPKVCHVSVQLSAEVTFVANAGVNVEYELPPLKSKFTIVDWLFAVLTMAIKAKTMIRLFK
jgi:hypothetical protein